MTVQVLSSNDSIQTAIFTVDPSLNYLGLVDNDNEFKNSFCPSVLQIQTIHQTFQQ